MVLVPLALGTPASGTDGCFWFVFVFFLGLGHPSTVDADTPLDPAARVLAWATIAAVYRDLQPGADFDRAAPTQPQEQPRPDKPTA